MNRIMKHHRIKVADSRVGARSASAGGTVADLPGVIEARFDGSDSLVLKYDLFETNLERIEAALTRLGIVPAAGLFERIKRGWIRFTEKNEYDNLMSLPTNCCALDEHDRVVREDVQRQKPVPKRSDLGRRGMGRFRNRL